MQHFELFEDRVLVKVEKAENKTAGGIIIPDTAKERPSRGLVVAVGPGKYAEQTGVFIPVTVKKNDHILFNKHAGVEIDGQQPDLLLMRVGDCLCKVPKK